MKYIFKDSCIGVSIFRQAGAAPTITLVSVGDITDSTSNVNVSIADGEDVSKTGVEIDTDPLFSNPTSYEENGAVNTIAVDNLDAETTYYVRAYVIWNGQTIYSFNSLNFTTESGSILPPELQACEYLETDGSAYIVLNVKCNNITNLTCKCLQNNASTAVNDTYIFGNGNTGGYNKQFSLGSESGNYRFYAFSNQNNRTLSSQSIGDELTFVFEKSTKKAIFNSEEKKIGYDIVYIGANDKLYIFGARINGVMQVNQNNLKIKELYQDSLFHVVNCYIKAGKTFIDNKGNICSAGTCGMYDVVNQVFYTNDGTGTFSKGADINI